MRFDDKLATVLAQPREDAAARGAAWRQIVDILAQMPASAVDPLSANAYDLLRALRDGVPQAVRAGAAAGIVGRRVHPAIVGLIAEEKPAVAAALIGQAVLADSEWLVLLPRLSPIARSLLRHRRDLGPTVLAGLASFGSSDFALPSATVAEAEPAPIMAAVPSPVKPLPPVAEAVHEATAPVAHAGSAVTGGGGESQIRDLLARIAAYRRDDNPAQDSLEPVQAEAITAFRFETGFDGGIRWVEGAPRGALVGLTIARAAASLSAGVDGQAAGAFRHRAPFRDARLAIGTGSPVAGEWRIAGVPVFDPRDGRFTGYRGTARRPRPDEQAAPDIQKGLYGSGLPSDSLRQLVHELRTPLNAIVGFGEMIERQVMGPAAFPYRTKAGAIVDQGRRLLGAVDDLDVAARIDRRQLDDRSDRVDPAALLRRLSGTYYPVAESLGVAFDVDIATDITVAADPLTIERMFARLLAATIGLGQPGETIAARLEQGDGMVVLRLSRPKILAGRAESTLLDPGFTPDGDWPDAPLLGLGFALRLIRNLAGSMSGSLMVEDRSFVLRLPALPDAIDVPCATAAPL